MEAGCVISHAQMYPHTRVPGKTRFCPNHPALGLRSPRKMRPDLCSQEEPSPADRAWWRCHRGTGTQLSHIIHVPPLHDHIWCRIAPWHIPAGCCSDGAPLVLASASERGPQIAEYLMVAHGSMSQKSEKSPGEDDRFHQPQISTRALRSNLGICDTPGRFIKGVIF